MKQIFTIFIAAIMLISSLGITLATHFCKGNAVKTSITFSKEHIGCGVPDVDILCREDQPQRSVVNKKSCCANKYVQLSVDEEFDTSSIDNTKINFELIAAIVSTYINQYFYNSSKESGYLNYYPPLLKRDIPVLIQSFLI